MNKKLPAISVFASGSGTNFQAIADAVNNGTIPARIALLVCDKPDAYVLQRAEKEGITTFVFEPKKFVSKAHYEQQILMELQRHEVEWIFLAGYMRIIGRTLLNAYPEKIVNIHPALLPAFPGANGILDAYKYGVKVFGVTVHFVDESVDTGKIIDQDSFKIWGSESLEEVENQIHKIEHEIYPRVIAKLLSQSR
ncbi:MAG: phosphoribosylglycinamide formyltransferase [Bacteroidales bacterium]|jgi:phosphoribosylglycinamide formyltransferase-1